jgi:hypothetical protein
MAMYMNRAAVDSWIETGKAVQAELVRRFEGAGLDTALIDVWTDEMIANSFEEEGASGAKRLRHRIEPFTGSAQ